MISRLIFASMIFCAFATGATAQGTPLMPIMSLALPTDNDALFKADGPGFYMFVDRNFENQQTSPWQGGQYGFVRGPIRLGSNVVMMTFPEGLDIAPLKRDAAGEPLDEVRSMSDGEVVYVNDAPSSSNYGRYVVIRHIWSDGTFYSLYAHLAKITTTVGAKVDPGTTIGIMGHTGSGLDRRRSHLHAELNVLLSTRFNEWHATHFKPSPNHHGLYNGLNLSGLDLAGLFLARQKDPTLTVTAYIKKLEPEWKAVLPRKGDLEILKNNPWLEEGLDQSSPSWEISFTGSGLPLKITPSNEVVAEPKVSWVKNTGMPHAYHTRKHVSGSGGEGTLSGNGAKYLELLTGEIKAPGPGQKPDAE